MIAPAFLLGLIGDTRIDVAGELLARVTNVLDHLGACGVGVAPTNRFEKCRVVVNGRLGPPRNGRVKTTRRVTRHKSDDLRESRCRCSEIDFAVELVVEFFKRSEITRPAASISSRWIRSNASTVAGSALDAARAANSPATIDWTRNMSRMSLPSSLATVNPRRGARSRKPSARRAWSASRAGVVEIPSSSATVSGRTGAPAARVPEVIWSRRYAAATSPSCRRTERRLAFMTCEAPRIGAHHSAERASYIICGYPLGGEESGPCRRHTASHILCIYEYSSERRRADAR